MTESIDFTVWTPWDERRHLAWANDQGVYLLAHFPAETVPVGPANPLDPHLVYIGETHSQTFIQRWRQFALAADNGNGNHAGGRTYHNRFGEIQDTLHVACFSPPKMESIRCRSFFIRYVEAKLVWDFAQKHAPDYLCNRD